ncbi:MAG: hypothetical protein WBW16_03290 [Bacteroidota bacterium]|jgi:hypothetical protein
MNHRRSILTVVAILTLAQSVHPQNNFRVQLTGGASFNTPPSGVFSNWGNGWTLSGGLAYPITSSLELGLNMAYSRYPYQGDNLQLVFPAIAGLRWSVLGEPSNVIEGSIAARVSTNASFICPYLSLAAGLHRLNVGEIIISEWFSSNPQNVSQSTYNGSGTSTTKSFAALGVGFFVPLDSNIRIGLEGRVAQSFDSKERFVPLLATVQVDL